MSGLEIKYLVTRVIPGDRGCMETDRGTLYWEWAAPADGKALVLIIGDEDDMRGVVADLELAKAVRTAQ